MRRSAAVRTSPFSINEAWVARMEDAGEYQFAGEMPNRREALTMMVCRRNGTAIQYQAMIQRVEGRVSLEETQVNRDAEAFAMAPFYEVWGRPLPSEWLKHR